MLWRVGKDVCLSLSQVADHLQQTHREPLHRSRPCVFCGPPVTKKVVFSSSLFPSVSPCDGDFIFRKNQLLVKRALWLDKAFKEAQETRSDYGCLVTEWCVLLYASGYTVGHDVQEAKTPSKRLLFIQQLPESDWTNEQIADHLPFSTESTFIVSEEAFEKRKSFVDKHVFIVCKDLRKLLIYMHKHIYRRTLEQLQRDGESLGVCVMCPEPRLLARGVLY